jgi:hypothetical protein
MPTTDAPGRVHVVLVPGFAGFDALGQIEYYANVTPTFQRWQRSSGETRATLHYFDSLPTAGVATRAARLRAYLAKRVARGELQRGDTLALVGHSTGGLDIRRMIRDLTAAAGTPAGAMAVDGAGEVAPRVAPEQILELQPRLAFLCVPQRGTNIADWVRAHPVERGMALTSLRANVAATRIPRADELQRRVAGHAASMSGADLFRAVQDALAEMDEEAIPEDAADRGTRLADAQEAEALVALWLRHMASDFGAIDDLAARPPAGSSSPAHFTEQARREEREAWRRYGIRTRSYASVAPRPFRFEGAGPVPVFNPYNPFGCPAETGLQHTDVVYRACWRACAGGPFAAPDGPVPPLTAFAGHGPAWPLDPWDNDGIVNTLSMLWPDGAETRLIHADHADVIGHFRLMQAPDASGRQYHTYDLLGSASYFDDSDFDKVWRDVFEFCASR